jgi:linalool 8-monooxygenase
MRSTNSTTACALYLRIDRVAAVVEHPTLAEVARLDDPSFYASEPHDVFARLRAEAPVYWCEGTAFWAVSRYEDARHVLRHPELFSSLGDHQLESWVNHPGAPLFRFRDDDPIPPEHALQLISIDKPLHTQYRKMVLKTGMFGVRATPDVELYLRPVIAARLAEVAGSTGEFDELISAPLATAAVGELLGLSPELHSKLQMWGEAIEPLAGVESSEARAQAAAAMEEMWHEVIALMNSGAREERAICRLRDVQRETEAVDVDSVVAFICDLIVAGVEALRTTMTGAIVALAQHRAEWDRVQADMSLMPNLVEELFRWVSPQSTMGRVACADTEIAGQRIARGDRVLMMFVSANRDETVWEHADRFDAGRDPRPGHLSFGLGTHLCVGAELSRTVLRVFLEELAASGIQIALDGTPLRRPGFNATSQFASAPIAFSSTSEHRDPRPRSHEQ